MSDLRTEIGELWRNANREIHERIRHTFHGTDLPPGVIFLLRQIHHEPGVTVSELARRTDMAKSHVSTMLDHLVKHNLVEKRPDPADQRLLRVYVTQQATQLRAEMEARMQRTWSEVLTDVTEAELETVAHGLRTMVDLLARSRQKQSKP